MIDMTSGIPSIIFGLVGVIVFIPLTSGLFNANGGNLISGALTMTIILLPIIIRTTEEALKVIPKSYRYASLALGANETQTTFKVVLPNAISGILTATLLSVGRIIGESAALIYAIGTVIKDRIFITDKATTLAVHIWSLMSGENPNFELSSAISIIILVMVFTLSMLVKFIARKLNYSEVK
jgi:phosphate transport system permease protein